MSPSAANLLKLALALPEIERVVLAEALLSSVPDEIDDLDDDAFLQELRRRSEQMKNDPFASIPWSEVKKMI